MANIARVYSVPAIFQGPVDAYLNIAAPVSSTNPTADVNCIALDTNGQPSSGTGSHLGSTEGPAQIQITEKCNEIMDDQHESPIDIAMDSVEAEIDFTLKETNLNRLQSLLTSSGLGAYTAITGLQAWQIGGQLDSSSQTASLLLVSPNRAVPGKFFYCLAYKCYLKSALQTNIVRNKESVWKVKMGCLMDLTRVAGDELMQIVKTK